MGVGGGRSPKGGKKKKKVWHISVVEMRGNQSTFFLDAGKIMTTACFLLLVVLVAQGLH